MKLINGQYRFQVKDLIESLQGIPEESFVCACFIDNNGKFNNRYIYKTSEAADETELNLYLGDNFKRLKCEK